MFSRKERESKGERGLEREDWKERTGKKGMERERDIGDHSREWREQGGREGKKEM